MFKTVLFPIDQTRNSQDAAEKVAELVKFCGSRLVVLTVSKSDSDQDNVNAIPPETVEKLLDSAKEAFSSWELDIETISRSGRPAFCICDVADDIGADLIMMGCRGVGLSEEHVDDSVSARVINLAPCPVMVIP